MYIFVASPGRSGTKYLSEIFKKYTNLNAYHGGEPIIRDIIDKKHYKNNNVEVIDERLALIIKLNNNNTGYFESNQIFIHYLLKYIIQNTLLKPLYVINLIRNPIEVSISYTNRNSYPSNNKCLWRQPLDSSSRILKVENHIRLSVFQENLIDWIDTQMKFEKYKDKFDKYYEFNFKDLNNKKEIIKLFNYFNIKHKIKNVDMKKNQNKKKTIITENYINETKELINYLKTLDNYPKTIIDTYFIKYF